MEKALITYFEIDRAGFYKTKGNGDKEPKLIEGSFEDTIRSVHRWVQDEKDFVNRIPWSPTKHKQRPEIYTRSSYFNTDTGDYFFVFWRKLSSKSGRMGGIAEDAKGKETSGDAHSFDTSRKGGKKLICGQPMYYWFIPEFDILATIKFPDSMIDTQNICLYLKRAIDNVVPHPCKSITHRKMTHPSNGAEIEVNTIKYESSDRKYKNLTFSFEASEKRTDIYSADLEKLAKKITHVVVRDVISTKEVKDDRHPIFKLFERVMEKKSANIFNKPVELETPISLNARELNDLVKLHEESFDPTDKWINIGFKEEGEDTPRFFNSYLERTSVMAEPTKKHEDIHYTAKYLNDIVNQQRTSLLSAFYSAKSKKA